SIERIRSSWQIAHLRQRVSLGRFAIWTDRATLTSCQSPSTHPGCVCRVLPFLMLTDFVATAPEGRNVSSFVDKKCLQAPIGATYAARMSPLWGLANILQA